MKDKCLGNVRENFQRHSNRPPGFLEEESGFLFKNLPNFPQKLSFIRDFLQFRPCRAKVETIVTLPKSDCFRRYSSDIQCF